MRPNACLSSWPPGSHLSTVASVTRRRIRSKSRPAGARTRARPARRRPPAFWAAVEDYVNTCGNAGDAKKVFASARADGFSAYVSDKSAGQNVVCSWDSTATG